MSRSKLGAWTPYLVLVVCLVPVIVPPGPGRTAIVDALNIPALGIFAASVLMTRRPIQVPFLIPVIFMSLGSLAATVNAANPSAAILTMVQDAYLYLWFGILATKANGGLGSLAVGLIAWTLVRAWTKRVSYPKLISGALIAFSVGLATVWLVVGMGLGSGQFRELQTGSILGRVGHSFEGRVKIWGSLLHRYRSNPLGYGPGNSRWQTVSVEERERPLASGTDPFLSKEAHNDYLAYLIERGPLALLALLVFKFQVFGRITRWWRGRAASAQGWVRGGPLAAATFGAWVASWINSITIETLHFRHVWLFLALVYALGKVDGDARRTQPGELAGEIGR